MSDLATAAELPTNEPVRQLTERELTEIIQRQSSMIAVALGYLDAGNPHMAGMVLAKALEN
jgi:Tfp pilus assembly protein PilF